MNKVIYDENGIILGLSKDPREVSDVETDIEAPEIFNYMVINGVLTQDMTALLEKVKADKIAEVKRNASRAILATNWRLERAREREATGASGESVNDVLLEREAIRKAGNRVESEVTNAITVEEAQGLSFEVTPADAQVQTVLSRYAFINRFTAVEMEGIITTSKTVVSLESMLMQWQSVENIDLTLQATIDAVNALESAGVIATGRAAEILG